MANEPPTPRKEEHGPVCNSVCGGGSVSHTVHVDDDPTMTEERWERDLEAYVAWLREREGGGDA